jgi:hypothetical protein
MAAGAAIASSNTAAATSSAYNAGVATGVAAGTASTTSAYNAGVATGVAAANTATAYNAGVAAGSAAASSPYFMGGIYPTLPPGCANPNVGGTSYYLCGNTWFQPSFGANGVSYRVVPTP